MPLYFSRAPKFLDNSARKSIEAKHTRLVKQSLFMKLGGVALGTEFFVVASAVAMPAAAPVLAAFGVAAAWVGGEKINKQAAEYQMKLEADDKARFEWAEYQDSIRRYALQNIKDSAKARAASRYSL